MEGEGSCKICGGSHPTGECKEEGEISPTNDFDSLLDRMLYLKENPPLQTSKKEAEVENFIQSVPEKKIDFLVRLHQIDPSRVSIDDIQKTLVEIPSADSLTSTNAILNLMRSQINFKITQGEYEAASTMLSKLIEKLPEQNGLTVPIYIVCLLREETPETVKNHFRRLTIESGMPLGQLEKLEQKQLRINKKPKPERIGLVCHIFKSAIGKVVKSHSVEVENELTTFGKKYVPEYAFESDRDIKPHQTPKLLGTPENALKIFKSGDKVRAYKLVEDALADNPRNENLLRIQLAMALKDRKKVLAMSILGILKEITPDVRYLAAMETKITQLSDDTQPQKERKLGVRAAEKHLRVATVNETVQKTREAKKKTNEKLEATRAELDQLLRANRFVEARKFIGSLLREGVGDYYILNIAFEFVIKDRQPEPAYELLSRLRPLIPDIDFNRRRRIIATIERSQHRSIGSSRALKEIGSLDPVDRLARAAIGPGRDEWYERNPSEPNAVTHKAAVKPEDPPKGVHAKEEGQKEISPDRATKRLRDLFAKEKDKKDMFYSWYRFQQAFMNLGDYIESTDFGKRLSNKYAEKNRINEKSSVNFQSFFEILKDEGVLYTIGEHITGVLGEVWYVNESLYYQIKENLAEEIRDIRSHPADQKRTLEVVAQYFGVTTEEILNSQGLKKQNAKIFYYRQILSYLIYELTAWSPKRTRCNPQQDIWQDKKDQVGRDKRKIEELLAARDKETIGHIAHLKRLVCTYA